MQIAIHLGAHCTDEDLILRTLGENTSLLTQHSVAVPPGGKARPAIRKALQGEAALLPGAANPLLQELLTDQDADRVVLSYEGFLGVYAKVLNGTGMYAEVGRRAEMLRDVFPGHEVRFYLALRNPATFIPALFEASSATEFPAFIAGQDLASMLWSGPVSRIREACPDVPLTLWCNEDLPLLWPDVLGAIAGIDVDLEGEDAVLRQVMTREGYKRFTSYLRDNPTRSRATWRKVVTAFLGKYADEKAVAPEITLPGWTEEMIVTLSSLYEHDVAAIRARVDVTFLAP